MHNTFTYWHSDLPAVLPEIKAEIVALDVQIADLIFRSQGNYRELEELAEVLDNCLDSCELNLKSIRIIADDTPQTSPVSMRDLPPILDFFARSAGHNYRQWLSVISKLLKADY